MARSRGRGERELPTEAPPQNDAYTGLLIISVLATLTALIFVVLDYGDHRGDVPKPRPPTSMSKPAEPAPVVPAEEPPPAPTTPPGSATPKKGD